MIRGLWLFTALVVSIVLAQHLTPLAVALAAGAVGLDDAQLGAGRWIAEAAAMAGMAGLFAIVLGGLLPAVADGERLELRLLAAAEIVLGAGIATGMALQYLDQGQVLVFDHKTLFALIAFAVIGALLIWRQLTGLRGRRAARLVLLAYLLLTLAYPGVKFVTDVLIA